MPPPIESPLNCATGYHYHIDIEGEYTRTQMPFYKALFRLVRLIDAKHRQCASCGTHRHSK